MLVASIIAFCILVFIVALLWPRISQRLERGGTRPLGMGQQAAGKAPGPLGRLLQKPFGTSRRAIHKSGSSGRRARWKLPF
jgi:hypothetical protein